MPKFLLSLFVFVSLVASGQNEASTYVPDDNFEQALIDLGYDDVLDDYVVTSNIFEVTELDIKEKNIEDLTGLEAFTALTFFDCNRNNITQLDVSQLVNLKILICGFNPIQSLDITSNIALEQLHIVNTSVSEIDLLQNVNLIALYTQASKITSLDLSNNINLATLSIGNSGSFDFLDVSNNTALVVLRISNSTLRTLDISNNITLDNLSVRGNSDLSCIQVADVDAALAEESWFKDDFTSYSIDCSQEPELTYIPDDSFESALIRLGYDDVLDDYVLTSNIDTVTNLTIYQIALTATSVDLTGLEDFKALKTLICGNETYSVFDISQLSNLEELQIRDTFITLDLSGNPELRRLSYGFGGNVSVPELDLSNSPKLEELTTGIAVDLSNNPLLKKLSYLSGTVPEIDVSNNPELERLNVNSSSVTLTDIDLSNNPKLVNLHLVASEITPLDLTNNPLLESLHLRASTINTGFVNLKNGNNEVLTFLNSDGIDCLQVENLAYAEAQTTWTIGNGRYSENCNQSSEDADGDGVLDAVDSCPNTLLTETVNSFGCAVSQLADLAVQNISIGIGSDPCSDTPNCFINIGVLQDVEINVTIVKNNAEQIFDGPVSMADPLFLENLTEGDYRICASHPNIPGFEQCYNVSSSAEENSVSGIVVMQNAGQEYTLTAAGSKSYAVIVNNNNYNFDFESTLPQQITFPLEVGVNVISVSGDLDCLNEVNSPDGNGVTEDIIELVGKKMITYPTITTGKITITNPKEEEIATISVAALNGSTIAILPIHNNSQEINLDISGNTKGMYIIHVTKMSGEDEFIKVILN